MATFDQILQSLRPGANYSNPDNTLGNVKWDAGVSAPTQQEFDDSSAKASIPQVVTPLQIRMALRKMGKLDAVAAWVAQQDANAQDAWQFASKMPINHPLIVACAAACQIDLPSTFTLAATFP